MKRNLFVTRPFLPPLEEFLPYLEAIWDSGQLTNGARFHQELERGLTERFGFPQISLFCNGTIALVTALQSLRISGEVITTPFTFAATAHSLTWNGIKPVFVDIEEDSFNIDPSLIEAAITPRTSAIMPVHVFGRPCKTAEIDEIARRYGLKVIYDAAHAFAVNCDCGTLMSSGDLSVLSFHATKMFHTFEGGAIVSHNVETKTRIDHLKNFGFLSDTQIVAPGINGKLSEIHAAMGLLQLEYLDEVLERRQKVDQYYRNELADVSWLSLPSLPDVKQYNYAYFPILVDTSVKAARDQLFKKLVSEGINARRYFYPLVSEFSPYRSLSSAQNANLPVAKRIAESVLCLPIYPDLSEKDLERIVCAVKGL